MEKISKCYCTFLGLGKPSRDVSIEAREVSQRTLKVCCVGK